MLLDLWSFKHTSTSLFFRNSSSCSNSLRVRCLASSSACNLPISTFKASSRDSSLLLSASLLSLVISSSDSAFSLSSCEKKQTYCKQKKQTLLTLLLWNVTKMFYWDHKTVQKQIQLQIAKISYKMPVTLRWCMSTRVSKWNVLSVNIITCELIFSFCALQRLSSSLICLSSDLALDRSVCIASISWLCLLCKGYSKLSLFKTVICWPP